MGTQRWTFEGEADPGQVVVAYSRAGQELGRWLVRESGTVSEAEVEAAEEPEWRIENHPPEAIPGSPA
jgi:hypothetical protein